jgi:LCCL domain-containing protein/VWA domain-containing protein
MRVSGRAVVLRKLAWLLCLWLGSIRGASAAPAGAAAGQPPAVLFVFDASGSMLSPIGGRPKNEIARSVMVDTLKKLPGEVRVGLVTFGHRRKGDCTDLEVAAPVGTKPSAIVDIVRAIKSKGETPLAEAVRLATGQLTGYGGDASIVVVSDGKDECGGDPCAATREALAAGVKVRIHVVGFDVGGAAATQLQCIAREGGGKYFSAANASQLGSALKEVERTVIRAPDSAAVARCRPPARGSDKPITCECSPESVKVGSLWGTELYTDDSSVCRAAVHAGVITSAGGKVTIYPYGAQDSYEGSERRGVYSSDYGAWGGSFGFSENLKTSTGGCPPNFQGKQLSCECRAKALEKGGSVWGTDIYTGDSSLCRAALHAGIITAEGGKVTVYPLPGQGSYDGASRNGVESRDYGAYATSFGFRPDIAPQEVARCLYPNLVQGKPVACRCRATDAGAGSVWGTDVYTSDSSICAAAVHAGLISRSGGVVTVVAGGAQQSFTGSERNGVSSRGYGPWSTSFSFKK